MVFIEGSGVGMDRNSYEKLWEIVIQPEINTFIDDFSYDASVFQELRLRLRVAPDAKELIWSRYCYYNRKCKALYMKPPTTNEEFLLDRHKVSACYMAAITSAQPMILSSLDSDEVSDYPISEFLSISTGLSLLCAFLKTEDLPSEQLDYVRNGILYPPKDMVSHGEYLNNFARELHFAYLDGTLNVLSLAHELFLLEVISRTGVGVEIFP